MKEFAGFLGWVTVVSFALALCNFVLKYISRNYMKKIANFNENVAKAYKQVMRYVVRYHKLAGTVAILALMAHAIIMFTTRGLSITGLAAASLMALVVIIGIYGAYVKKKLKAPWFYIHRTLSFLLIAAILIHVL